MKYLLFISFITLSVSSCKMSDKQTSSRSESKIITQNDHKIYTGQFTKITAKNKSGRSMQVDDIFFKTATGSYFVKQFSSVELKTKIIDMLDKVLTVRIEFSEGLWDTNDPNVQSRVGKYILVHELMK